MKAINATSVIVCQLYLIRAPLFEPRPKRPSVEMVRLYTALAAIFAVTA